MRHVVGVLVLVSALGCGGTSRSVRRSLVTDNIRPGAERSKVRAWHLAHDWCQRRTWSSTDEYQVCDPHPYLDRSTPAMHALFGYAGGRARSMALFIPVPCRMYGRCDRVRPKKASSRDLPFVELETGLVADLAGRGQRSAPTGYLPSMQRRMLDGLAEELEARYGEPIATNRKGTARIWRTPRHEIVGLFLSPNGTWVVETHEFATAPEGSVAGP